MRPNYKRIVIFRALKLGDMLCSIPALRSIRTAYPQSSISLICHKSMKPLMERYHHYIDEIIPFAGFPGIPEQTFEDEDIADFISSLKERKFDLSIQMHGSGEISNQFVELIEAQTMLAFQRNGNPYPSSGIFLPYPEHIHEIQRCLKLLEGIQIKSSNTDLEFPLFPEDYEELEKLFLHEHIKLENQKYICIHPGASNRNKCWEISNFTKLADELASRGHKIVFTGFGQESELIDKITSGMINESINTAQFNLPLGQLAVLLKNSSGLVCNDTGVSHLAVALNLKSFVIFTNSDIERWAPLDSGNHISLENPSIEAVESMIEKSVFV